MNELPETNYVKSLKSTAASLQQSIGDLEKVKDGADRTKTIARQKRNLVEVQAEIKKLTETGK